MACYISSDEYYTSTEKYFNTTGAPPMGGAKTHPEMSKMSKKFITHLKMII